MCVCVFAIGWVSACVCNAYGFCHKEEDAAVELVQDITAEDEQQVQKAKYNKQPYIVGKQLQIRWIASLGDSHLQFKERCPLLFAQKNEPQPCIKTVYRWRNSNLTDSAEYVAPSTVLVMRCGFLFLLLHVPNHMKWIPYLTQISNKQIL